MTWLFAAKTPATPARFTQSWSVASSSLCRRSQPKPCKMPRTDNERQLAYRALLGNGGHCVLFQDDSLASTVEKSRLHLLTPGWSHPILTTCNRLIAEVRKSPADK